MSVPAATAALARCREGSVPGFGGSLLHARLLGRRRGELSGPRGLVADRQCTDLLRGLFAAVLLAEGLGAVVSASRAGVAGLAGPCGWSDSVGDYSGRLCLAAESSLFARRLVVVFGDDAADGRTGGVRKRSPRRSLHLSAADRRCRCLGVVGCRLVSPPAVSPLGVWRRLRGGSARLDVVRD